MPIVQNDLAQSFKDAYYEYGIAVVEDRALADVRDGLKPVHRRIIYSMLEDKVIQKNVKVAKVVGQVMGKYHPHGDTAIADALVNLSLPWKVPLPLVHIKGNNGSVAGDPHAAARYIETRLTDAGLAYGKTLSPAVVPYIPNYDDTLTMPSILPAELPYLLINGSSGVAVGVAGNIPPHNPKEVVDTLIRYIKNPKLTTQELMETLPGPDFPTAGYIINRDSLYNLYESGSGTIAVKGVVEYSPKDKKLHIRELPFTSSGSMNALVTALSNNCQETVNSRTKKKEPAKFKCITEVADHSGKDGIDIALTLKSGVKPEDAIQELCAKSQFCTTMSYNFTALNDRKTHVYSLRQYFKEFLSFRHEIVEAESRELWNKCQTRMEIIKGLMILQQFIDPVIACAKVSLNRKALEEILQTGTIPDGLPKAFHKQVKSFRFTPLQASHIAGLAIHRISKMDFQALIDEGTKLQKEMDRLQTLIDDPVKRKKEIIKRLQAASQSFDTPRRTVITQEAIPTASSVAVEEVPIHVAAHANGYVQISPKAFEGTHAMTNYQRVGMMDVEGVLWNLHLDRAKPTTGKGVLYTNLLDAQGCVGWTYGINTEDTNTLTIYSDGHVKRCLASKWWTKTKTTKVQSSKNALTPVWFGDIPKGATTVTIQGKTVPLDSISQQKSPSGKGIKLFNFDTYQPIIPTFS